jgi:predicted AlkP superfamily phosphohydrolase/phosphomutase
VRAPRLLILGLDCASPGLCFERFREAMPALASLARGASFGTLHSVHPPITVPAWASMVTGLDPGELGLYGFQWRAQRGIDSELASSRRLGAPTLFDLAGRAGLDSIVVGFPLGYPVRPLRGHAVAGMLTPPGARPWTYPDSLADEIEDWVGAYRFDVDRDVRAGADPGSLAVEVADMTRRRFRVLRRLLATRPWQLSFFHEIGLDRLQHAVFPTRGAGEAEGSRALLDYHRLLDAEIEETLARLPEDTVVAVVSDHGARPLEGSFCLNDWLRAEGYLALRDGGAAPGGRAPLTPGLVDWERTRAWAEGGYCGRVHLHGFPRDGAGALASAAGRRLRDEIREKLEAVPGPDGAALGTAAFLPEEVYARVTGVAPDLLVYPGDLAWRCAGSVGEDGLFLGGNDTGPDRANHDWEGLFVLRDPASPARGEVRGAHLLDVAPTLCEALGIGAPGWMRGGRLA